MAFLNHPGIIRVFDFGEIEGLLYLVMEYVPGKSLERSASGKAIDPKQAVEILLATCEGVSHAHDNDILHRDIRPANILLTPERQPKLGDFGISSGPRTESYLAPEAAHDPRVADKRADVFSLGVILRELLTGIPAQSGTALNPAIADPKLDAICRKATSSDPATRYPDANAFKEELNRWKNAKTSRILVSAPAGANHRQPFPKRHKPATVVKTAPRYGWMLFRNCATIALLLGAIHLVWGVYQAKQSGIARLQQEQGALPPLVKVIQVEHPVPTDSSRTIASANYDARGSYANTLAEGNVD